MKLFSTRFGPRSQATILPVNCPAGAGTSHSGREYGGAEASTTGSGEETPAVMDAPLIVTGVGPPCSLIVVWNVLVCVEAATVVVHGPRWSVVSAPGPELPADAETSTPAAYASRKASSTGSLYGSSPPEIEKLITRTPSRMARATAAAESDGKQPSRPHTL
ncbi:hypothetical protein GCM10020001_092980 [Nonomuraea salmonea]